MRDETPVVVPPWVDIVGGETPYERGLRRERELRAALPLRQEEVATGESPYKRGLRHEQELRVAVLASVDVCPFSAPRRPDAEVAAEINAACLARERCIIYWTPEVDEGPPVGSSGVHIQDEEVGEPLCGVRRHSRAFPSASGELLCPPVLAGGSAAPLRLQGKPGCVAGCQSVRKA
jgi:hypothetical protein